ncbi:MAG TPA: hypothetical protein VIQ31_04085, partial [Phormidium sp.]
RLISENDAIACRIALNSQKLHLKPLNYKFRVKDSFIGDNTDSNILRSAVKSTHFSGEATVR